VRGRRLLRVPNGRRGVNCLPSFIPSSESPPWQGHPTMGGQSLGRRFGRGCP
jgi:hypothetical protein